MAEAVIHTSELTKAFRVGFGRSPLLAIRRLDLTVQAGQVMAFVGPNGAGKTTTIHVLLGLLRPSSGQALVFGEPPCNPAVRRRVGYQAEVFATYRFYTASQALRYYGGLAGLPDGLLRKRVPELLTRLGLADAANRKVKDFSKGMTQRLGLAQALIHDPHLLILDEPTSGLDPAGRKLVADIILEEKARGKTVFLSSHILSDVERVCDSVALIHRGELLQVCPLEAIARLTGAWEIEVSGWKGAAVELLRDVPHRLVRAADGQALLTCAAEAKHDVLKRLLDVPVEIVRLAPCRQSLEELYMQLIGDSHA